MGKGLTVAVLAVCAALAACDNSSTRDLTAPSPGAVTPDAAALGTVARYVTRPDGSVSSVPGTRAGLSRLAPIAAAPVTGTTTTCDQGAIVEDTDENGLPNGHFFPFGGVAVGTYDNILVPLDKVCVLDGVTVIHNVTALTGSRLFIYTSEIGGNVSGLSARVVQLNSETIVSGNVDVRNAGDLVYPFASCSVENSTVDGDLSCTGNNPGSPIIRGVAAGTGGDEPPPARPVTIGGSVTLANNFIQPGNVLLLQLTTVGGNADVNKNTGAGGKSVDNNTVAGKLDCKKNDAPFNGGPNVANKVKGQCF